MTKYRAQSVFLKLGITVEVELAEVPEEHNGKI
jgi:hypothetical protein